MCVRPHRRRRLQECESALLDGASTKTGDVTVTLCPEPALRAYLEFRVQSTAAILKWRRTNWKLLLTRVLSQIHDEFQDVSSDDANARLASLGLDNSVRFSGSWEIIKLMSYADV